MGGKRKRREGEALRSLFVPAARPGSGRRQIAVMAAVVMIANAGFAAVAAGADGDLGAELDMAPAAAMPDAPPADAVGVEPTEPLALFPEDERFEAAIDKAVAARLARRPPLYVPATDFAPPKGLVLHATTHANSRYPFALALTGFIQGRWLELARSTTQWTNSAGETLPVNNENEFNLNRIYIAAQGYVGDERVVYNLALFASTAPGVLVSVAPVGFVGYSVTEDVKLGMGVTQVPGSREWLMSSQWPMGVDRSMVNTFMRPSYSPGFFSIGSLFEKRLCYEAGVWNGLDGGAAGVTRGGTAMAWAGNTWWEPLGPFGLGYSDMEHHAAPALRLGMSGVTARSPAYALPGFSGVANPENTVVRLSDGTPLAAPNALGPGTQVTAFNYQLATADIGWKYRGWSAFGEYYWRLINGLTGTGSFDRSSLFDQGGNGFVGWCFVPRTYEIYGRSSALTGPYGSAHEVGGGLNWYMHRTRQNRLTLEALYIDGSPAQNPLYPYRAGFTGTAIQTQYMVIF